MTRRVGRDFSSLGVLPAQASGGTPRSGRRAVCIRTSPTLWPAPVAFWSRPFAWQADQRAA